MREITVAEEEEMAKDFAEMAEHERLRLAIADKATLYVEISERGDVENEYRAYRKAYDDLRDAVVAFKQQSRVLTPREIEAEEAINDARRDAQGQY